MVPRVRFFLSGIARHSRWQGALEFESLSPREQPAKRRLSNGSLYKAVYSRPLAVLAAI